MWGTVMGRSAEFETMCGIRNVECGTDFESGISDFGFGLQNGEGCPAQMISLSGIFKPGRSGELYGWAGPRCDSTNRPRERRKMVTCLSKRSTITYSRTPTRRYSARLST